MPLVRALVTQRNFTMYLLLIYDVTVINRESCYFAVPRERSGIVYFLFIVTLYGYIKIISNETRVSHFSYTTCGHTIVYLKKYQGCLYKMVDGNGMQSGDCSYNYCVRLSRIGIKCSPAYYSF